MNLKNVSIMLLLSCVLTSLTVLQFPTTEALPSPRNGPRTEDLIIYWYDGVECAYEALKTGEIDIVMWDITREQYKDAIADPSIVLAPVTDMDMYEFDINNNWTIATYPGVRSPTSYLEMRQAMAFLTDKDTIVSYCCGGFAERIDQPVAAPTKGWMNESYMKPYYPYEYDPLGAKDVLDTMFPQGTTDNPFYDPAFPGSVPKIRTYPVGHEKAGEDLDPLICCVRTDDRRRLCAGRMLYENLRKHGVPVNPIEADMIVLYDRLHSLRDYHFYTGGWSLGRFPIYLYYLYHSDWWYFPFWGPNYVTGVNETNEPNYPDLDELLEKILYCESFVELMAACKNAMGLFTEYCITVPLWSSRWFWAYSSDLLGVVSMDGYGPENGYTFMNAYKTDGTAIRCGLKRAPFRLNVIDPDYYDSQVLRRFNMYGGADLSPYNIVMDQAGWVQDWHTSTWFDPIAGVNKTKLTLWFRKDAYWVKPVTGAQGPVVDAWDFLFSGFTQYACYGCWEHSEWAYVHHFNIVDDFCVEVYFDSLSYWLTYDCRGPIIPRHVWLQEPLAVHAVEYFHEGINLTTPSVVPLSGEPVWFVSVTADGVPLEQFTEWNWVKETRFKSKLEIFVDLPNCTDVYVDYWAAGDEPRILRGYTPGGLPWQTIFEGAGMYYVTDFFKGVDDIGGFIALKRNPYYWMETPPLGEIDFVWKWGPRDPTRPALDVPEGPRTGCYKIDMYDIVMACGAYGSTGTAVPSPNWFAGADLAAPSGKIDMYDIVTICAKYGTEFGHTP